MPFGSDDQVALRDALLGGPRSARELAARLRISQATLSRLVRARADDLLTVGRARATRYALRRRITGVEPIAPIYEIMPDGTTRRLAHLHPVATEGFYVESLSPDIDSAFFRDLPYFLYGMRPSGFLGRRIPSQFPELGLPESILHWSADHCLRYFATHAWDPPGAFIVGERSFQTYLQQPLVTASSQPADRASTYAERAIEALAGGRPGSSAAGEQPKFLVGLGDGRQQALVKFSPPLDQEVGRRVADLLVAEHLALETLTRCGANAALSELVQGNARMFLQVLRFDRTEAGRHGVVTLAALDNEYVGNGGQGQWPAIAAELGRQRVIDAQLLPRIAFLSAFGELIGNTDMHGGNLAFLTRGTRITGLAPAYDMLPMLYMPQQGHILDRQLTVSAPSAQHFGVWREARDAAEQYYADVAKHPLISRDFSAIAERNARTLNGARSLAARLPE
ncbi:MAG TPA: type II toxin-antitoxin system HipA family toxin YjjJ [Polyangiaceae bacterium]